MLNIVVQVLNFVTSTIKYSINITSLIGEVLIFILSGISSTINNVISNFILFVQIVYEDNLALFTDDIPNGINNLSSTFLIHLQNDFLYGVHEILYLITNIFGSLKWVISAIVIIICEVSIVLRNGICILLYWYFVFLGNLLWTVLTFFPVQVMNLIKNLINDVVSLILIFIIDIYNCLFLIANFLTDVPLQSLGGILCSVVIIRVYVHFWEDIHNLMTVLYWSVARKSQYIYHTIHNYFYNSEMRLISAMINGQEVEARSGSQNAVEEIDETDYLCIVCQERQKCVLILPCRHVCLCTECCMRLYEYQRTCPMCRTFIYHSVTVYL